MYHKSDLKEENAFWSLNFHSKKATLAEAREKKLIARNLKKERQRPKSIKQIENSKMKLGGN